MTWGRGVTAMDRRAASGVEAASVDAGSSAGTGGDPSVITWPRPDSGRRTGKSSRPSNLDEAVVEDTELDQPLPNAERLVAEAVTLCTAQTDDEELIKLVAQYWRLVPDEDLVGRTPEEMVAATESHRDLARQRLPGELKLRVTRGAPGKHTALEIVTDDMPFLVDSVTAALTARELDVHLLVHPLVVVCREPTARR